MRYATIASKTTGQSKHSTESPSAGRGRGRNYPTQVRYRRRRPGVEARPPEQQSPAWEGASAITPARPVIQAKLTVNQPGDVYEQEADRVADQVMRMAAPGKNAPASYAARPAAFLTPTIQRMCSKCEEEAKLQRAAMPEEEDDEARIQREPIEDDEEMLQAKSDSGSTPTVTPAVDSQIRNLQGSGQSLDPTTRGFMESRFGRDFSDVRVHTDAHANQLARSVQAKAFTTGNNIVFRSGQYNPTEPSGQHLLAHELTHVVQQSGDKGRSTLHRQFIQRQAAEDVDGGQASSGELAWEIFKPVVMGGIRSLGPKVLKATKVGQNNKHVIDIVVKLEGSVKKIKTYEKKVRKITTDSKSGAHNFKLKSLGKVNKHFQSIPDALDVDGDALINEASKIVTSDMFTKMGDAVTRLQNFAVIVEQTKQLRNSYSQMVSRLTQAETQVKASFDALGILQDALFDLAKHAAPPRASGEAVFRFPDSRKLPLPMSERF